MSRAPARRRLLAFALVSVALGLVATLLAVYSQRGLVPGDALVYLAAGERLNAGHDLYALQPGDREVGLKPPFWTVPLLSPPLIGVVWRPLAALPSEWGVPIWWAMTIAAIAVAIGLLLRRDPLRASVGVIVLSIPLVYEIGVGNLNAFILLGVVAVWLLTRRSRDGLAGAIIGVLAVAKLQPAVLGVWLLTQQRWRGVGGAIVGGVGALVLGIVGAGLDAHLRYVGIVRSTAGAGTSELSLAGLGRAIGLDPAVAGVLPFVALAVGVLGIVLLRRRPGAAFAVGVGTMVFASPVVNVNWYALLIAALAPFAWPIAGERSHAVGAAQNPEGVDSSADRAIEPA